MYRFYDVAINKSPLHIQTTSEKTKNIPILPCQSWANVYVIMYHYIREPDKRDSNIVARLSVPIGPFREQMKKAHELVLKDIIAIHNLSEVEKMEKNHCYTHKNIFVFTADDGWSDTYDILAPIAREYKIPFSFSIISGKLDVPGFITTTQLKELIKNPLFSIMSHSINHLDQGKIPRETEKQEMCDSKNILESLTQKPINTFIYPAGRMSASSQEIAKECGYTYAFTTNFWISYEKSKTKYDINRYRISDSTLPSFFEYLISLKNNNSSFSWTQNSQTDSGVNWNNYLQVTK